MSTGIRISISGTAAVYCIHDRLKREVTDVGHVALLGLLHGEAYDARQHKVHLCPCCENLFVRRDDIPHYCPICTGQPVHQAGGPLPEPKGVL